MTKEVLCAAINGANSTMVSVITVRTVREEEASEGKTFDLVQWIRVRKLQWIGHILRMGSEFGTKTEKTVCIYVMFKSQQPDNTTR